MKRLFPVGPTSVFYLDGAKVDVINMTPCCLLFILGLNPDAKIEIEQDGKWKTTLVKYLKPTP